MNRKTIKINDAYCCVYKNKIYGILKNVDGEWKITADPLRVRYYQNLYNAYLREVQVSNAQ